jgi:glycosyltransferase involved in cell wall biosynthesis
VKRCSVIIITLNEERHIAACLESVSWADEIIVVDSQSEDRTVEIARRFTPHVVVREWQGYSGQKNIALDLASGEWVLWIDADERVTPELATEIRPLIDRNPEENGFEIARRAFFLGQWIRHCGWYPGYVLRLFRREQGRFDDRAVHEGLELSGPRGRCENDLLHYTDDSLDHYMWKFNRYTSLAADELAAKGRRTGWLNIFFRPFHMFIKMYILKKGFLDGVRGLMLSMLSSAYVAVKYIKLWEQLHSSRRQDKLP